MSVRVAESLLKLRSQIDAMAPGRDTSSNGPIGDPSSQAGKSDYAPNSDGVVTAIDITHDPTHGVDAGELAEQLRLSKDPRIKYVISNGRVFSSQVEPWRWRPYMGADAHAGQAHVAVINDKARYDDTRPWAIQRTAKVIEPSHVVEPSQRTEPPRSPQELTSKRYTNIIATVFGGAGEIESSAYDRHRIGETEFGVALPFRFEGSRPDVKVTNPASGHSVVCQIVDVGPWNTDDPYWESGSRPRAESGRDRRGRLTNRAGISLTPAAARAIGLGGKAPVDWEFVAPPELERRIHVDEVDRGARVQVDELVQRLESLAERTSRDDIPFRPSGYEAFPTTPGDIGAWRPTAGARALNESLSVAQMRSLSPACRMPSAPAPSGVIVSGRRTPDDGRWQTIGGAVLTFPPPPPPSGGLAPTRPDDAGASLEQLMTLLMGRLQTQGTATTPPPAAQQTEQVRKAIEMLTPLLAPGPGGKAPPLGQVNGALGETLGNLLNGKKTAIGVLGALVTSILSQVPAGSGLGQVFALLTPTAGLSPFAMPIFLAFAAWGVLGKLEKWSQQTAVAEGPALSATSDTLQRNMNLINLLLPLLSDARAAPPPPPPRGGGPGARGRVDQQSFRPIPDVPGGQVAADRQFVEPIEDLVDCSVFGPPAAPPGEYILIQVFLHLPEQAERASFMASLMDPSAASKGTQSLQTAIKRGATVEISLAVNTLVVAEPVQSVVWRGQPAFCQFLVAIPPGTNGQNFFPNVRVSVDGRLVGRIMFRLSSDRLAASLQSKPLGEHARRYRFAFVSYAAEDRKEVLKRVQMLEIMRTEYFQDLLSLDPGDRWERKLYENIDRCDLFLLFWSQAAKDSRWVIREAEFALGRQRRDPNAEPDVVPVILQQNVLPPPSLADLHFNDRIHYMIAATP